MFEQIFAHSFAKATQHLQEFSQDQQAMDALVALSEKLCATERAGGKILIAGNGGSMADAMHFAEELSGRFRGDRRPLAAMAIAEPTHMSCVANDYGFDHVFSRMVEAFGKPGDVLILLSTSGNSKNIMLAAQEGKKQGMFVFGFLGKTGGALLPLCDLSVIAPGETSDRIQELHMLSLHILVEAMENGLGLC